MASVTVQSDTSDGFINNQSGVYDSEIFNSSKTSSSSDLNYSVAVMFFNTLIANLNTLASAQGQPSLTGATITSIVLRIWVTFASDVNGVGAWYYYTDINNIWGESCASASVAPGFPSFGTTLESPVLGLADYTVGAWNTFTINAAVRTDQHTHIAIRNGDGDIGPSETQFDAAEGTHPPELVITYTPAASNVGGSPAHILAGRS